MLILIPITKLVFPFLVKGEDFPKALNLLPIYYFAILALWRGFGQHFEQSIRQTYFYDNFGREELM